MDPCSLEICTKASILLFIFTSLSKSSMFFSLNFFHIKREVVTCQFVFIVDQHVTWPEQLILSRVQFYIHNSEV